MRKAINYIILGTAICMGICGCGIKNQVTTENSEAIIIDGDTNGGSGDSDNSGLNPDSEDVANENANADSADDSTTSDEAEEIPTDYVHGTDGYFSLIDDGIKTPVKTQESGTCWVTAASTSMESSYKIKNGVDIEIDPLEILEAVQGAGKDEGYFIKDGVDGLEIGGWAWQITETLSNGFGDYILLEAEDLSSADIDVIKERIKTNGAMNVAVNDGHLNLFTTTCGYKTLNDPDSDDFDHEVTIVGWDDNFPKEYFVKEATRNGAWLAQNTRSEDWGNEGYYWISYDTPFTEQTIFRISSDYSKVLSYDGGNENRISTGNETTVANVFHEAGTLKAVGTYCTIPNQKLKIEIYDKDFSEVLYTQEAEFELNGYHTVILDKELDVNDYAIAITFTESAPVEGAAWDDSWLSYSVGINEGESFILIDGDWMDMANEATVEKLDVDFEPNNCCVKAIY